jgi:hypothetical protein
MNFDYGENTHLGREKGFKMPGNAARNRERCKGKTWEQMYGKEKADELKAQLMVRARAQGDQVRGMTREERYGAERAEEIRDKIRASIRGYVSTKATFFRRRDLPRQFLLPRITRYNCRKGAGKGGAVSRWWSRQEKKRLLRGGHYGLCRSDSSS